ncbi:MAG: hypothetical protein R2849_15810 [Thermomicrobiales bacterium]
MTRLDRVPVGCYEGESRDLQIVVRKRSVPECSWLDRAGLEETLDRLGNISSEEASGPVRPLAGIHSCLATAAWPVSSLVEADTASERVVWLRRRCQK